MKRRASIVILKHQTGQLYLVANGCPHARPDSAPFYACAASTDFFDEQHHLSGSLRLATCEFLKKSDETHPNLFEIECAHDDGELALARPLGLFGNPIVTHAVSGDSDGGELD